MNSVKKVISSPFFAIGAFALAAALLLSAGIGGASAALNAQSEVYSLNFDAQHIGVQVCEDGAAADTLALPNVPSDPAELVQNEVYDENLTVKNLDTTAVVEGTEYTSVPEYVRVIIYKYWEDEKGNRIDDDVFSADKINLTYGTEESGWNVNSTSDCGERVIMSYANVLQPGEETTPFVTGISFDVDLIPYLDSTTTTYEKMGEDGFSSLVTKTVTTFDYNGLGTVHCVVEVEAQGVQTHNYEDAMTSAWGYIPANVK